MSCFHNTKYLYNCQLCQTEFLTENHKPLYTYKHAGWDSVILPGNHRNLSLK